MLFYLSCLLKAILAFTALAKFISGFSVDTSLILFVSIQILTLDYLTFKDNGLGRKNITMSLSYLDGLMKYLYTGNPHFDKKFRSRLQKSEKLSGKAVFVSSVTIACFLFGSLVFFVSPLYSHESAVPPDLCGLKQYTADTNFMSFEGYIISYYKIKYGVDISRGEARKIVKASRKRTSEAEKVSNDDAIAAVNSVRIGAECDFDKKYEELLTRLRNTLNSVRKINAGGVILEDRSNRVRAYEACGPESAPGSPSLAVLSVSGEKSEFKKSNAHCAAMKKYNARRVVLLPFKDECGAPASEGNPAFAAAKKELADKGYSVVSGADIAGVCFNLDNIDRAKVRELAKKFDANYIVTGASFSCHKPAIKIIDATSGKKFVSLERLN